MIAASILQARGYRNFSEIEGGFNAIKKTEKSQQILFAKVKRYHSKYFLTNGVFKKYKISIIGVLVGGILGYAYYHFIGCSSGTCHHLKTG
jgi:hypothetical protein